MLQIVPDVGRLWTQSYLLPKSVFFLMHTPYLRALPVRDRVGVKSERKGSEAFL